MKKLKIYIETSVWNFLIADDAPEKREITEKFFEEIAEGKYEIYISEAVELEIAAAPPDKKLRLLEEIQKRKPEMLDESLESRKLALSYIEKGLLSNKHIADLSHIAIATVNDLDIVLSWNMRHMVKIATIAKANAINKLNGYHEIRIHTPEEVIENGD